MTSPGEKIECLFSHGPKLPAIQMQYHVVSTSADIIQCAKVSHLDLHYFALNSPPEKALSTCK